MTIELLLRRFVAAGDERALTIARASLDAMAAGGIHDQLGGGFHRYATDARWLVPHFEQMLYDNAQLARVYVHAWALTGDRAYRDTAVGVLDYLLRELRTADGGFAASQDADTEGEEGATFVWSAAEVRATLAGAGADPALFAAAYGVTDEGNWEGSHDPVAGARRRRARRSGSGWPPGSSPSGSRWPARRSSRGAAAGRSPRATTRCWRPGTGSRSRRWRTRPGRSAASGDAADATAAGRYREAAEVAAGAVLAGLLDARGAAAAVVEGRPRHGGRRARGPRQPRRRPARAVRGDLRRALVPRGRAARRPRSWNGSPTRPAASSTRPTTASRSSCGRRTSRTTRRHRATRWRRPCSCGSRR